MMSDNKRFTYLLTYLTVGKSKSVKVGTIAIRFERLLNWTEFSIPVGSKHRVTLRKLKVVFVRPLSHCLSIIAICRSCQLLYLHHMTSTS